MKTWILHGMMALGVGSVLAACDSGVTTNDDFWYTASGSPCSSGSPSPGCEYYASGGTFVRLDVTSDPYYTCGAGEETGIWTSPDGLIYDNGNPTNEADVGNGKDALSNGAAVQQAAVLDTAHRLAAKYQLDANTSLRVVNAMNQWVELGHSRQRTPTDIAAFTQQISGLNADEVSSALNAVQTGDANAYDAAIAKAAQNWSTNPDTMKQILTDWFVQQQARQ